MKSITSQTKVMGNLRAVRERDWQQTILEAARVLGWTCYHTYDSRRSVQGFPDLTCVRDGRLVFMECKTEQGRVSAYQERWLALLNSVPQVRAYVVRPSQWDLVEALLKEGA